MCRSFIFVTGSTNCLLTIASTRGMLTSHFNEGDEMETIQIKNRYTGEVIFEHTQENNTIRVTVELAIGLKISLEYTNLESANLRYVNLESANLRCANLESANLEFANLESVNLRCANLEYTNLESANLRYANLESANLRCANLESANLEFANLRYANLEAANLEFANLECVGDMRFIFTIQLDTWHVGFTKDVLQIGCQRHTIEEWRNFTDDDISGMHHHALEWWKKWRNFIFQAIEISNASA